MTTPDTTEDARRVSRNLDAVVVRLSDSVSIIHADCRDVLPVECDAVVTDPPYGVGLKYATHDDKREGYDVWCAEWFGMLKQGCRGAVAISIGQANLTLWARMECPTWWLAWWKPAAMGRCVVGFNNWEPIAVYGKVKHAGCDVIRATIKPDDSVDGHPCPKPIEWAVKQVAMLSDETETVCDPFMGTGTTGIACIRTGRKFIGIEKDARYFEIARARLESELRQGLLPLTHNKALAGHGEKGGDA